MANIYDAAKPDYSRTLRDLPEYKAVVESKQAIEANQKRKRCLTRRFPKSTARLNPVFNRSCATRNEGLHEKIQASRL